MKPVTMLDTALSHLCCDGARGVHMWVGALPVVLPSGQERRPAGSSLPLLQLLPGLMLVAHSPQLSR
jgi:hypothetical protein